MTSVTHQHESSPGHIFAIRADSLREQVSRALEAALVAGELQPGVIYSAPGLAEQFGVSATPVREAMLDLVKDGFVEVVRNKGFRVLEVSESDLDQISQIRLLLEVPSTAMAAATLTPAHFELLARLADEVIARGRPRRPDPVSGFRPPLPCGADWHARQRAPDRARRPLPPSDPPVRPRRSGPVWPADGLS